VNRLVLFLILFVIWMSLLFWQTAYTPALSAPIDIMFIAGTIMLAIVCDRFGKRK
jgi:hypothetical protein